MSDGEAFSPIKIDAQLADAGWGLTDGISVRFAYTPADGTEADYVLCDRNGRTMAVLEAKRASINPVEAEAQALGYAKQLFVPLIFLANGAEVWFWDYEREVDIAGLGMPLQKIETIENVDGEPKRCREILAGLEKTS